MKYVVKPGDTLSLIARRAGLEDYREIYDDPRNAAFRRKRPDPNRIAAGDVLWIPASPIGDGPQEKASLNRSSAAVLPAAAPTAVLVCPVPKQLRVGVFFDGTDNNMDRDAGLRKLTNVARLYRVYRDDDEATIIRNKNYWAGVGSLDQAKLVTEELDDFAEVPDDASVGDYLSAGLKDGKVALSNTAEYWGARIEDKFGGAFGHGARERLEDAYAWVKQQCSLVRDEEEKRIDVFGFSRGAAIARTFVNLVNQALKREVKNVRVRFLGVFDTVESYVGDGLNCAISAGDAEGMAHLTAIHEIRKHFPLTTMGCDTPMVGVHSDIGGGYGPVGTEEKVNQSKTNRLAFLALEKMHARSKGAGVELKPWQEGDPDGKSVNVAELQRQSDAYLKNPNSPAALRFAELYIHQSAFHWDAVNAPTKSGKREIIERRPRSLAKMPPDYEWSDEQDEAAAAAGGGGGGSW